MYILYMCVYMYIYIYNTYLSLSLYIYIYIHIYIYIYIYMRPVAWDPPRIPVGHGCGRLKWEAGQQPAFALRVARKLALPSLSDEVSARKPSVHAADAIRESSAWTRGLADGSPPADHCGPRH